MPRSCEGTRSGSHLTGEQGGVMFKFRKKSR